MTVARWEQPATRDWIALLPAAAELAKSVAGTDFVPRAMRDNPATIAAAVLYGDEVGLGPMQSLAKISVIDGRPTLAAETQRALILAAGHSIWLEESTVSRCTWAGRRRDEDVTSRVTWTMDDARRANLAGKANWRSYPRAMLSARASAELARAIFADVIGGLAATEETDEAEPDQATGGEPAQATGGTTRRRRRTTSAVPAPAAVATISTGAPEPAGPPPPPLPGEVGQPMSTGQRKRLMALFRAAGITDRGPRLTYAREVVGRDLRTSSEMTADEVARVIAALEETVETPEDPLDAPEPDDDQLPLPTEA
jgi:hypothetical protein